jgi:TRAP transporter 4TM/12TM fusion protein
MAKRAKRARETVVRVLAILLCFFTLVEVNYPRLSPQSQLALFAMLGMVICFLSYPSRRPHTDTRFTTFWDIFLSLATAVTCLYVVIQTEPLFQGFWLNGRSLGNRAGAETGLDIFVGIMGTLLVLEVTRRALGLALPVLAALFLGYAYLGSYFPDWLFPHRGYSVERIVAQGFLHSQGVFGIALKVMFTYVFLFVLFGALLEVTGATEFIIEYSRRLFRRSPGGAAKVAVLSSGLMGSLSGSAVANAATTGTFTIPLMRSAGFRPHIAAGVTAAASSGGALVPPVMGAGAYMMLEIIDPPVTYLQIVRAALIPAFLYYLALFLIVHFYARRVGATGEEPTPPSHASPRRVEGIIFFSALGALIFFLLAGYTVFRAVTLAIGVVLLTSAFHPRTRMSFGRAAHAMTRAANGGVALISAAACVGIILGVVTLTGIGTKFPSAILQLAGESLLLALVLIMVGSIILGMGLPSAVCYLLMATLIGSILGQLGVIPLAAHLFIFYFGMMSMVTPPVALAAYTAASIAGTSIMPSAIAAFRFALVGFTLPFMFVFRPELLLMATGGGDPTVTRVVTAVAVAVLGIIPLAAGIAGYLWSPLSMTRRFTLLVASALLLYPGQDSMMAAVHLSLSDMAGVGLLAAMLASEWRRTDPARRVPPRVSRRVPR